MNSQVRVLKPLGSVRAFRNSKIRLNIIKKQPTNNTYLLFNTAAFL